MGVPHTRIESTESEGTAMSSCVSQFEQRSVPSLRATHFKVCEVSVLSAAALP